MKKVLLSAVALLAFGFANAQEEKSEGGNQTSKGKILIEATEYFSTAKRTVILQDANEKSSIKERRTITDHQGKYCFEVKPGMYQIRPVLTQDEKDSDLHLQPEFYDLEIIDRPLLDVNFYQSKVQISGKINCSVKPIV